MKNRSDLVLFAIILALPFIKPVYFWPLILLAYSPFFIIILNDKKPFLTTTCWYTLFMSIHTTMLFLSLIPTERSCSLFICLILLSFFIALQTGLWFHLIAQSMNLFQYLFIKITFLSLALFIFFLFFDRALFWFLGADQGYSVLHPLLPLSCFPPCSTYIAYGGEYVWLMLLIISTLFFSFLYQASQETYRGAVFLLLMLGITSAFFPIKKQKEKNPLWLSRIAFSQVSEAPQTAYETAQEIKSLIENSIDTHPEVEVFMFPESTFCYSLCHYPSSLALITGTLTGNKKIIFGAHQKIDTKLFSCCFIVDHSGITYCYTKKKLLFFAEEVPSFFPFFSYFKQLFLGAGPVFYPADKEQEETVVLFDDLIVTPFLCSELFLGHKKRTKAPCIIALVNDRRFSYGPFCDLLCKTAHLKALLWGQSILYTGYKHQVYIASY